LSREDQVGEQGGASGFPPGWTEFANPMDMHTCADN